MGVISHKSLPPTTKIEPIDFNKTGVAEYTEFLAVCCDYHEIITPESMQECFNFLSQGGEFITIENLLKLYPQKGVVIDKKVWAQVFPADGRMDFKEYKAFYTIKLKMMKVQQSNAVSVKSES